MPYSNIMTYYPEYMYGQRSFIRQPNRPPRRPMGPGNRPIGFGGGFLLPFALGFASSPLIFGATRPRPPFYGPYPPPYYGPYPY